MREHIGHWPLNRNHEAARRHVDQVLRDHAWNGCSRRETAIAELLDDVIRERDLHRGAVEALTDIANADPVDLALDPDWAVRIAREALSCGEGVA